MFNGQVPAGFARTLELTVIAMVIGLALSAALANIVEASIRVKHMRLAAARQRARPKACSVHPGRSAPGISSPS
jgi:ABC-type amino acid transport system permease subunit